MYHSLTWHLITTALQLSLISQSFVESSQLPADFIKGIELFSSERDILTLETTKDAVKESANIGVEWIALAFAWQQDYSNSTFIYPTNDTCNASTIETFIHFAKHDLHLKIMLKPEIQIADGSSWVNLYPSNLSQWFESYSNMLLFYANLSQTLEIDAISIGLELYALTTSDATIPYFTQVIDSIRDVYTYGKLTYSSLYSKEYKLVPWWNKLDWIGIDAYFPLYNTISITHDSLTVESMIKSWNHWLNVINEWKLSNNDTIGNMSLVFTEIGYPSYREASLAPWYGPSDCSGVFAENDTVQEMCYQALFSVLSQSNASVDGVFMFWLDNEGTSDYYPDGRHWPCWWTPRGKPAWKTLSQAFGK